MGFTRRVAGSPIRKRRLAASWEKFEMRSLTSVLVAGAIGAAIATSSASAEPEHSVARIWDEHMLEQIALITPRPPIVARILYHVSAGMYDAWAAYDPVARGVFFHEKHTASDVAAARHEAISYAACALMKARFNAGNGPNIAQIQASIDTLMIDLGYDPNNTSTVGDSPSAIGNRVANAIMAATVDDGANQANNYAANNGYLPVNSPMPFKIPGTEMFDPGRWQPLAFDFLILQNGEVIGAAVQEFIGPHWGGVVPFALIDVDRSGSSNLFFDQGAPWAFGSPELRAEAVDLIERHSWLDPADPATINISPAVFGNAELGNTTGPGYGSNPVTGQPYPDNIVLLADYARTVAEYWADGPDSETPPGHWHSIANAMSDQKVALGEPLLIGGVGVPVDRLEWDVKMYVALGGANHDAAITAWGMKNVYDSSRPISFIRRMAELGQSSDPGLPSYHPHGLPLIPGLIELITEDDVAPGGRFEDFVQLVYEPLSGEPIGVNTRVGEVAVRSWLGGFYGGVTGVATEGPLPAHVYRNDKGWHIGAYDLGVDDAPGALNFRRPPRAVQISEIRLDHQGDNHDIYIELSGPPGASLDGITYVILGDEVQTGVPSSQGRVQQAIDLTGHVIGANGTFLIGKSAMTLASPDLSPDYFTIRRLGNSTHLLVTDFVGYLGQDLDFFNLGFLIFEPWSAVLDSLSLRRSADAAGIYSTTELGPDEAKFQTYGVGWMPGTEWMPYQASNFVTPPFAGYTSGHSTYSRASAEALAEFTGSEFFPGGLFEFTLPSGWSNFEVAPSTPTTLQWVRYYDAADESGLSRVYGGIHPLIDDFPGRISGAKTGKRAVRRSLALFKGLAQSPDISLTGVVGGQDLGLLLENWGGSGVGDLNGDGVVNGADLGILLTNWGF